MRGLRRVHVACADAHRAERVLATLRAAGARDLEVRGSIPLPDALDPDPPERRGRSKVLPAAICGGLLGGLGAWLIATQTALAYPMVTGGMPLIAPPPVAIVTYEGTAFGLILATVAAVVIEGRLWRRPRPPGPLDGLLTEGWILTSATVPEDAVAEVERRAGALGGDAVVRTVVEVGERTPPDAAQTPDAADTAD